MASFLKKKRIKKMLINNDIDYYIYPREKSI